MNTYGILKHFLNNNKKLQEKNRNNNTKNKKKNNKPHSSTASCFINVIHKVPWEQVNRPIFEFVWKIFQTLLWMIYTFSERRRRNSYAINSCVFKALEGLRPHLTTHPSTLTPTVLRLGKRTIASSLDSLRPKHKEWFVFIMLNVSLPSN